MPLMTDCSKEVVGGFCGSYYGENKRSFRDWVGNGVAKSWPDDKSGRLFNDSFSTFVRHLIRVNLRRIMEQSHFRLGLMY